MDEAEVTQYIEDFPLVEEIQRKLAANKREKQVLNQMLKIAEQRESDRKSDQQDMVRP